MEDKFKKYFIMQKAEVFFIASLIYDSKNYTKKYGGCFMAASQSPDTTSHVMVPTSRIIEKLEIAYGMGLDF